MTELQKKDLENELVGTKGLEIGNSWQTISCTMLTLKSQHFLNVLL